MSMMLMNCNLKFVLRYHYQQSICKDGILSSRINLRFMSRITYINVKHECNLSSDKAFSLLARFNLKIKFILSKILIYKNTHYTTYECSETNRILQTSPILQKQQIRGARFKVVTLMSASKKELHNTGDKNISAIYHEDYYVQHLVILKKEQVCMNLEPKRYDGIKRNEVRFESLLPSGSNKAWHVVCV